MIDKKSTGPSDFLRKFKELPEKAEIKFEGSYDPRDLRSYLAGTYRNQKFKSLERDQQNTICKAATVILESKNSCEVSP